nr:hypothetical protein Y102A5C.26 - Caenorhabditis elegans [Caenorhabditis elegans]
MLAHEIKKINYYSNLKNFDLILMGLCILLFIACIIIYTILLPFYIYANKVNHKRDKEILIYPITKHFYKMVILSYIYFNMYFRIVLPLFTRQCGTHNISFVWVIRFLVFFIYSLNIITQAFHVLLFVLAVERFFLYFFPSSEKLFKSSRNKIKHLYFLIIITCSINDVLVFFSAILYIPIVLSIRKLVNLQSAQRSKPHKYIFLQTMMVFTFKSIQVLVYLMTNHNGISLQSLFICAITVSDIITTPLIVQMSYLSCNKRNMKLLLSSISARKLFNVLLNLRTGATVLPRSSTNYSTHI